MTASTAPSTKPSAPGGEPAQPGPLGSRQRGLELLDQLHGRHAALALIEEMRDIAPAFIDMSVEWALGGVLARPGLDLLTRELLVMAACTTLGHAPVQVRAHAEAARALGATREQLVEAVLQLTFYASGPAIRASLLILRDMYNAEPETSEAAA